MRSVWGLGLGLCVIGLPAFAAADARVQVRLTDSDGRPVDGTVTMVAGARRLSCRTTAGRCTITAPAGSYSATVAARSGGSPAPRTVSVPASGTITLAFATPAPAAGAPSGGTTTSSERPPTTGMTVVGAVVGSRGTGTSAEADAGTARTGTTSTRSGGMSVVGAVVGSRGTGTSASSLSSGTRVVCQGTVRDAAGRAVDATITVRQGSTTLGTVRTTAGRFSIYDLAAGSYSLAASGAGGSGSATLRVSGSLARPTITLRP